MRQSFTDFTNRQVGGSCAIAHSRRTDNVILTAGTNAGEREDFIMREIREYNINGTIILGVDNGYGNVKTAHRVFQTGIMKCDSEPVLTKEYIEYDGAYYIIGEGHKGFVADKQEDDDTYIMTLAAIAKEIEARGLTEARIHLAVGLPLKWVQAQRDSFKKYLTRERYISMKYRKVSYLIEIADCTVMPQGYAAVAENLKDFMGMNMLVDVGNGIMNIMYLNNGRPIESKPEVALRELLQNSIDACLLRQKLSELWGIEYTPKVKVSLYTKNNVDYLQVSDNGVGMNQHIIDNYYTNIGCSYYSSREFSDLMVSFKSSFTPISRFGIGILSCFMVCDSMEVTTRRIRERFECDEALHVSIEGYESLFVISDSDKKDPGTDTILTLRPVHPWDRMDEDEFVQCIKGIVPNPAVQIEIETDKRSESYSSDYFDDLDLSPLLDYSWNNTKNIRKIDIDLTCEEYGFKGRGCIGILIKNDMPVEEIEILSKDVEIDGEIYTLSSSVKYKNNCITETSTSISVDEDGEIDTNTSWSERFKSKSSLSIHGIEVPYNLFPNYSNKMSKAVLNILFPFSFRLDIGVNSDLNLNSARDQIIYDEKWLTFEENLYQVICKRLKEQLSLSDWERLNEIIQKNGKNIFSRVANNIE